MALDRFVNINSGEYYVSRNQSVTITTLLGSCVAVCIFDAQNRIGGMNHYMLPHPRASSIISFSDPRYGKPAVDILVQAMLKKGASREALQAKVFGGGRIIEPGQYNVAEANVEFAISYLKELTIPIVSMDVGGYYGRKLYYQLNGHQVFVKKTSSIA